MNQEINIYDLYLQMKEHSESFSDFYKEGKFWANINKVFREELQKTDFSNLRNSNFNRRFAGPDPSNRQVYRALLNLYYKEIEKKDFTEFLKRNHEPEFGGAHDQELYPFPHGSLLYPFKERRPMSLDFLQSTDEALTIVNAFQSEYKRPPQVIVELGSGYGRLGYVLRKLLPECTYIAIDLPEALICCHYYLNKTLGGKIANYSDSKLMKSFSRRDFEALNVWTLATQQIESIEDKSIDVFINIFSFAEMPKPVIDNYLSHADRITDGLIYLKQRKFENNKFDEVQVREHDYNSVAGWHELLRKDATLYPDFFEVLFRNN